MKNSRRISKKIEKKYKRPIDNLYSHRFYEDLFTGYAYSLSEKKLDRRDFFFIVPDDREIIKIFSDTSHYDFSYDLERTIDNALYSMAVYGKAYIFVRPEYIEKIEDDGKKNNALKALHIGEIKGILKKNTFYYRTYSKEISSFDISEGVLISLDLKELGFKRNYFTKLVKRLGKYDTTSASIALINNEPTYDFSVHVNKNQEKILRKVSDIGWRFGTDGLSDSYILYKEIKMKIFKMRLLQYVLEKINKVLADEYFQRKEFRIEARTKNIDYVEVWEKYNKGELTVSDLNKILWHSLA